MFLSLKNDFKLASVSANVLASIKRASLIRCADLFESGSKISPKRLAPKTQHITTPPFLLYTSPSLFAPDAPAFFGTGISFLGCRELFHSWPKSWPNTIEQWSVHSASHCTSHFPANVAASIGSDVSRWPTKTVPVFLIIDELT